MTPETFGNLTLKQLFTILSDNSQSNSNGGAVLTSPEEMRKMQEEYRKKHGLEKKSNGSK